jgi:putative DNA primase/helicase
MVTETFRAAMRAAGLDYAGPIVADGRLHRFKAEGDKARNSWFVIHAGPPAAGAFGCWKRGLSEKWCSRDGSLSQAEWDSVRRRWQEADRERERTEKERHAKARKTAAWILSRSKPADGLHPYLQRKGVKVFGDVREWRGALVLPLRDANGELHSLQFIGADGVKKFLAGGRIAGCFFTVGEKPDGPLVIVEGCATGASVHEATGFATVGAMNAGNLLAASKALREKFPSREIIVAGDNDQFTNGNPGLSKAREAAKAIGALLAVPQFADVTTKPTDFNDLHQLQGLDAVKTQIQSAAIALDGDWPHPKPLPADLPSVPPFGFDSLPESLRPWIEDGAERMQCPPDFPAAGAIVALGSLVGRKIGIRPKRHDDWLVVPNLWGCIVGRPGLMKTPALEQPLLPLRRLAAEALDRHAVEKREHEINAMLQSQTEKIAEKKIAAHLKKGNQQAARAEAETVVNEEAAEPVCRRYETNDPTIEKLGVLLAENPTGLLLFRDELVGFLRGLDREGHESDRATYLEMWNGTGSFISDRIQRGTVRTPAILSILGGIQPDLLTAYVREAVRGGQGADGLLQRFQLFVWPDVSRQWRNVDRWPDTKAKNEAFAVFKYLDELTPDAVGADTSGGIPFLRFAHEAQQRFDVWRAELEARLRNDTEHPAFEAHLAKYRKLVPALALLTHLANRATGPVSLNALNKALLWTAYLEAHARRIYSAVLRPDTAAARELAKHLERGELPSRFTLREVYRKGWAGLSDKDDAEAATEILCDLGWIRAVVEAGQTKGRPASPTFETNPKILNSQRSELTKLTKSTSGSFVSEAPQENENFAVRGEDATKVSLLCGSELPEVPKAGLLEQAEAMML